MTCQGGLNSISGCIQITHLTDHYDVGILPQYSTQYVCKSDINGRLHTDLVLRALLMAVWRRQPPRGVIVHSDQGSQYTSGMWQSLHSCGSGG